MKNNNKSESLTEFKKSLFYGDRNNLFFKFLGGDKYSEKEFAEFLENLLDILANSIDTNDFEYLKQFIFQAQLKGYKPEASPTKYVYEDFPWAIFSIKCQRVLDLSVFFLFYRFGACLIYFDQGCTARLLSATATEGLCFLRPMSNSIVNDTKICNVSS